MSRTAAIVILAVLSAGCTRYQSRGQGPFGGPKKEPPPPYGSGAPSSSPKPVGGQSPLGMVSADPAPPPPPDERSLIPPRAAGSAVGPVPAPKQPTLDPAAKNLAELKSLVATSRAAWNNVSTYELQLTRREINPRGQLNSEVVLVQYRREPMSVFTRNIGGSGKGRETVYNPGAHEDKLYVMLGEGDSRLMRAGIIAPPVSPDDSRVKEKARYSVREAGFGRWITGLSTAVANVEAGRIPADVLTFDGEVKRDECSYPLVGVTHRFHPGDDPLIAGGGTRHYFFDMRPGSPSFGLPVLLIAFDAAGKEVEYYLTEKVKNPAHLTDANFNPARLGK
ncbi:MAG: DUF1571 domain-containing protein [Planctomycetes bacterium]|nr:DUF1571 domain-containing protein [Planctomycetota bacterium]